MIAAITGTNLLTFLITGLTVGGIYALSALGLVVVYRATGVLNFAQGAVGAIAALTLANEFIGKGRPEALGYIAALALAIALSLFYGLVISPRLSRRDPIVRAMGALGYGLFILGFCGWRWTARDPEARPPDRRVELQDRRGHRHLDAGPRDRPGSRRHRWRSRPS